MNNKFFSLFFLVIISTLFSLSRASVAGTLEKGPFHPQIPAWTPQSIDCSNHIGLSPHKKTGPKDKVAADVVLRNGYKAEALHWFKLANERASDGNVADEICYALEYTELGGFSAHELSVDPLYISILELKGYYSEATKWIVLAIQRSSSNDVSAELEYAKEYFQRANDVADKLPINWLYI